jgi:membrane protease YdiL (CAAX protease family)
MFIFVYNHFVPTTESSVSAVETRLSSRQRCMSFGEILLGTFIVIGHNVFHILPNEVPILFVLFWISLRFRDGGWRVAGLKRPKSWLRVVAMAMVAAAVLQVGSELVVQPLASHLWHRPEQVSSLLKTPAHDWKLALRNLALVWIFAGFGEELGYRGYLLTRAADVGDRSKTAYFAAMLYVAVLFGFGHFYKGPEGIMDSTYSGLVLGSVYLVSDRNLWVSILAHGVSDTFAVAAIFMGWAT